MPDGLARPLQGHFRCVPVQECRSATAASEVVANPDRDDPSTHAESVLAGSRSHALILRTPATAVTESTRREAMPQANELGCAVAPQAGGVLAGQSLLDCRGRHW